MMFQRRVTTCGAVPWLLILAVTGGIGLIGGGAVVVNEIFLDGQFTGKVALWILQKLQESGSVILQALFNLIPDEYSVDYSVIQPYLMMASDWIPIDYIITLIVLYFTFLGTWISARFAWRLIPGVG